MTDDVQEKMVQLRPVNFVYKSDENNTMQYGLIAEEVNDVFPNIVVRDAEGEIYTLNYMALIPMLIKHNQLQDVQIKELQALVAKLLMAQNMMQ